jgi:asparagine synthase (glutamine-hydrolysing)
MCGISGLYSLNTRPESEIIHELSVMNEIQRHRGPDGDGVWCNDNNNVAFGHVRLSIIDIETGLQPMTGSCKNTICFNGEIYNYIELKKQLSSNYSFKTNSDTEVILAAYQQWGKECVNYLRGMFAFSLYDAKNDLVFCARDRFGIKPFYFLKNGAQFYFASEVKTILPFLEKIETSKVALNDYLFFQLNLGYETLFEGINQLSPAHRLIIKNGKYKFEKYWEVFYNLDFNHNSKYYNEKLNELIYESIKYHTVSDVPIGAYVSGGVDSSIIASVANKVKLIKDPLVGFTGKFAGGELFDESYYAENLAENSGFQLFQKKINSNDFIDSIEKVIYHLDYPVAGPGSFPQYQISEFASKHRKVILGGQGGDEIFGGYTRYLIAYFEQCIKGAIDNTLSDGNFIVTYDSIIPNLVSLKNYKPLMKKFFSDGLFEPIDKRYFKLINRAPNLGKEINWEALNQATPTERFNKIFNADNVGSNSFFDKMTHFDFKTLLPALLQVEDRMSMAHGLESRVPFLDHPLVEFAATMPADIKFKNGTLKKILINSMKNELPSSILDRKDKMGFPVPLNDWLKRGKVKDFVYDTFSSNKAKNREYFNNKEILKGLTETNAFGRKVWGLLSLEIWQKQFHDQHNKFKNLLIKD